MECGWGGIGYLLLSKNFKAFEALSGCLKAHKYESFLDMLNSCDKATISSVDSKGRTLIHLLLRHLGERDLEKDSPELKRAFEVMDFLVSKHGLNSNARDLRGYNLLHTIALKGNITAFCGLILRMPKAQV
jgi:ankyrin repeat protein